MASEKPLASADGAQGEEADLAKVGLHPSTSIVRTLQADQIQAFQELAKGERTAAALEAQLTAMESKIDALLEQAEREQGEIQGEAEATKETPQAGKDKTQEKEPK